MDGGCSADLARFFIHPFRSNPAINTLGNLQAREERPQIIREAACAENVWGQRQ
jgi:hypothetical protein